MSNSSSWSHPLHARGIRSGGIPTPSTPLTDSRIAHYCRNGFYGSAAQRNQLAADAEKRVRKVRRTEPKASSIQAALDLLLSL